MSVKDDCKELVIQVFGNASGSRVDDFPDDKVLCIMETQKLLAAMLGEEFAKKKLEKLKRKHQVA